MEVITNFQRSAGASTSIALGNFDGVHLGHQLLLSYAKKIADKSHYIPAACTFTPHPMKFYGKELSLICTHEQKLALLKKHGMKICFQINFNQEFSDLTATEFLQEFLVNKMNAKAVVVGNDFYFGRDRAGNTTLLQIFCENHDIVCTVLEKLKSGGKDISSSRIRNAITNGDIDDASAMLGRYIEYSGNVIHGDKMGATIGFPTANLRLYNELYPADGVYSGYTTMGGQPLPVMIYIGNRPTVTNNNDKRFEVNIINYNPKNELYGQDMSVTIIHKIRPERKFDSFDDLKTQLFIDQKQALKIFLEKQPNFNY